MLTVTKKGDDLHQTNKPRIMVCPLDWGLGHATRCIPLIKEFIRNSAEVTIAGDGHGIELLKHEFPELKVIRLKGYNIRFSKYLPLSLVLLLRLPELVYRVIHEHQSIKQIIKDNHIDILVSDNRYGLWNKQVLSVFITHQLNIIPPRPLGFLAPLLRKITRWFISRYDECWIPDTEGNDNLSGLLSHGYPYPSFAQFVGPLSRFEELNSLNNKQTSKYSYPIVAILSGPEPQRTILERKLIEQLSLLEAKSLIIRGIPESNKHRSNYSNEQGKLNTHGKIDVISAITSDHLFDVLKSRPVIISRGGYSTLMDLAMTGNKLIAIPTPGQTEQLYLAKKGALEGKCIMANQDEFNIQHCLTKVSETKGYAVEISNIRYKEAIHNLLSAANNRNTL